ncbi:MAG: hypothetical protein EOP53_03905 [Sphingobacteriales bacterium]|nr:MAG: hypothetical protein EOP53_03905 [Sphingobacteriales bacterium]
MYSPLTQYLWFKKRICSIFLALLFLLLMSVPAKAQFSLLFEPAFQKYTGAPKNYPFLIGLNPRVAFDIKEKMQVSISSNIEYGARWQYKENMRLTGIVVSTFVPMPVDSFGLGVVEFSALYSYFLLGKNYTRGGLYISGGPGAVFYIGGTSGISSTEGFLGQHTDYVFDARLGGQYDITIGWLYLEGRFAPTLFSSGVESKIKKPGSLYGLNIGVRYLLNRHPYCTD